MIAIIEANDEHIPLIQEIAHQTWPITFGAILSTEQIDYMLQMMYSKASLQKQIHELDHHFLLANHVNGSTLGFISYETTYKGKNQTKIHKIYILPAAQGIGIGRKLMEMVEAIAHEHGDEQLLLHVNKYNDAEQFYQHLGFQVSKMENIDIGNGFLMEDKVMAKYLVR